jgi:outer membrane protein OmpA-like peptidoglycan-associated protein
MVENKYDENNSNTVLIRGAVTNSKTGIGIAAQFKFRTDSIYTATASADGKYKIRIPSTKIYTIEVEKKGYVNLLEKLDIQTLKLNVLEMNFKLQPIEVGTLVNLKSVLFYMGTTSLLEESYPELDAIVDFLKTNPKVEIELEGHTDNRGDAKKNVVLSQERVGKIKSYLVSKGVSSKRVKGKGFGGSKPIATSDSEEARRLNRRVEFLIVKN